MNIETVSECCPRHGSWFRIAALTSLGVIVATVFIVVGIQFKELRQLKAAAIRIKIGDSPTEVSAILGEAKLGYECGWPSPGAPPAEYGQLYGGRLDYLREDVDLFVNSNLAGVAPYWSYRSFRAWPVWVQYSGSKRVTAVFIDGIKAK